MKTKNSIPAHTLPTQKKHSNKKHGASADNFLSDQKALFILESISREDCTSDRDYLHNIITAMWQNNIAVTQLVNALKYRYTSALQRLKEEK